MTFPWTKQLVITNDLNKAGALYAVGATLIGVQQNKKNMYGFRVTDFMLTATTYQKWYVEHIGIFRYKRYMKARKRLKQESKALYA